MFSKILDLSRFDLSKDAQNMIIGFPHPAPEIGGPGTFQTRICQVLKDKGHQIIYPEHRQIPDVILVVGGTRKLQWIWKCKQQGAKVVLRLDGLNWQHRLESKKSWAYWRAEAVNLLVQTIRKHFADVVVYQSEFIRQWWQFRYGSSLKPEHVIYNATDLNLFSPLASQNKESSKPDILCIEGSIHDNPLTREVLSKLPTRLVESSICSDFKVYGKASTDLRHFMDSVEGLNYRGTVQRSEIPEMMRGNHLFLPLEPQPPCPNAVIEALASGLPVVGFDTGSLRELVPPEAGILVPYGGDAWAIDKPDVDALQSAIEELVPQMKTFQIRARQVAEERFDIDQMTDNYLHVIKSCLNS